MPTLSLHIHKTVIDKFHRIFCFDINVRVNKCFGNTAAKFSKTVCERD